MHAKTKKQGNICNKRAGSTFIKVMLSIALVAIFATIIIIVFNPWNAQELFRTKTPKPQDMRIVPNAGNSETPGISIIQMPPEIEEYGPGFRLPRNDCIVDKNLLRLKVIIKNSDVYCSNTAGGTSNGNKAKRMNPYLVFDVDPPGSRNPAHYLIGDKVVKDSIIGWVPARHVQLWSHRIGVRPIRTQQRRPTINLFATKEDLVKYMSGDRAVKPAGTVEYDYGMETFMPWPVIEKADVEISGQRHALVRIAALGDMEPGSTGTRASASRALVPSPAPATARASQTDYAWIKETSKMIDVVFVIDSTQSMNPVIEAAKAATEKIAASVDSFDFEPDVAFGLVEYRDYVNGLYFNDGRVYKVHPLVNSIERFRSNVKNVRAGTTSSVDCPEAVKDGLKAGLEKITWRGQRGLVSMRIIVLIGDNSGHEPGHTKNPNNISEDYLVQVANRKGMRVNIFSLCCHGPGTEDERKKHAAQFKSIATRTGGQSFSITDASKVADRIYEIATGKISNEVKMRSFVVEERLIKGTSAEAVKKEIGIREYTEVVKWLKDANIDIDEADIKPGVPVFSTAWVSMDYEGIPVLQREVYSSKIELDVLISELHALKIVLNKNPKSLRELFDAVLNVRVGEDSWFAEQRTTTLLNHCIARFLPVGSGTILKIKMAELISMTESKRRALSEKLERSYIPDLHNEMTSSRFPRTPDNTIFGWVREHLIP